MRKMADTLDAVEAGILSVYEEHLAEGVDIKTVKKLMEEETWLDGTKAAEYFRVKVGEENTVAAAVQDFTKMYCRNAPKDLVGAGTADNERLRQQDQEKEKASLHLLWHTWAGKEIERRTDNDKRRVNEDVKKGP